MSQFFSNIKKYLLPVWVQAKPYLSPILNYLNKGTVGSALFLVFMLLFAVWGVLWGITPMLLSNFRSPITLTGEEIANLRPRQWQRYTIETQGSVPIGIRSWFEQREYGVITTYRSGDSYWGVYIVGDYYIYLQSEREDNLERLPEILTGRLGSFETSTLNRLNELIPDMPDTLVPLLYSPQSLASDLNVALTSTILGGLLVAMAWFFHHQAIKRNRGRIPSPMYSCLQQMIRPMVDSIHTIWQGIKFMFGAIIRLLFQESSSYDKGSNSSNNDDDENVITIDPSKIRHINDDET